MSQEAGTLERLLLFVGQGLEDLGGMLQPGVISDFLAAHGVRFPDDALVDPQISGALADARAAAQQIGAAIAPLKSALEGSGAVGDAVALIAAGAAMAANISATLQTLDGLAASLTQNAATIPDADMRARVTAFTAELPRLIIDRLVLDKLDELIRGSAAFLALLGLADDYTDWGTPDDPSRGAHRVRRLYLDRLVKLAKDPSAHLRDSFGWGAPDFDAVPWFERYVNWREARNDRVRLIDARNSRPSIPTALELGFLRLQTATEVTPPGLALKLNEAIDFDWEEETELRNPIWLAYISAKSRFEAGLRLVLTPDGKLSATASGAPQLSARAGLKLEHPDGEPITLLGISGGTRLEALKMDIAVVLEGLQSSPFLEIRQEGLHCVLDLAQSDSFAQSMSGGGRGQLDVSVGASWSPASGLKFSGSAALEIAIPAHARLGPATIETIYLIGTLKDGKIPLEISAAIRGDLGPFHAVVDRIGVELEASFPEGGGNLGPMQLDTRFKPPKGVGLSIDGGGFGGGGFLRLDPDKGEYAGSLELQFMEVIDVKAVGVLNTRLPDGSHGYSLVIIISAEFAPIQLGFGFTLIGVGGLLGVHRTVLDEQLRLGVRDGSLSSILFPKDVVANAPRIINDLQRVFPPRQGRFLIGPMGKLGWGTPTLISLEIGVILEIPRPAFFIVGILRMALPTADAPVLNLQVNFAGSVDFDKKQLSFDAALFDSRVLTFTLTGGMAVRIYWGDDPNFLLTVGGFHPAYTPPPMALGQVDRIAIVLSENNPRIRAEGYFALTSNTVQFGAKIELEASVKVFNVYGFVSLDALMQFDPFRFVADVAGMLAVRSGSSTLFAIRLELRLEGPAPWHAHGRGSFEIGFIITVTLSVSFDVTIGEERTTTLPPVRVAPLIEAALNDAGNWRAITAARARGHVSARELPAGTPAVIAPFGALGVVQKVAPLNLQLSRLGAQKVEGPARFSIVDVRLVGMAEPPPTRNLTDQFAAAQFLDMSDAEKLSRRSFEPFDAGLEIGGSAAPKADFQRGVDVTYEVIYVRKPRRRLLFRLRDALIDMLVSLSAAGRSKLSAGQRAPSGLGTPKVTLPAETFVIAGMDDLRAHSAETFVSESAAVMALKDVVAKNASLAGKLQVVSAYEAAA